MDFELVEGLFPAGCAGAEVSSSFVGYVSGGEAQQFQSGLVGGEMPPGFGDFPELIVDAFHDVGCVDDLAKLRREP